MARTTPRVDNAVLVYQAGMQQETVQVGSEAWQRWLDDTHTTTFRFVHRLGTFTARKERRRWGGSYWYAYRKQGGRLRKGYLGRTEELTRRRLDEVAARLAGEPAAMIDEPSAAGADERLTRQVASARDAMLPPDAMLATKLHTPPVRQGLVERPRLMERLSAGLHCPLTLIVAPAGSGKTTLLSAWYAAQASQRQTAWLALDAGDDDLARFLRYLVAALQTLRADIGLGVLASLRSPQPPVDVLLTHLLNDLATQPDDVVLILDDYHLITAPAVHRAMTFLLDHLPPRVHLVIATRADPPLPLSQLRARGQLAELRGADLRFTAGETTAFLNHTMGLQLAADDTATLETRTEGWIAGLQLAALSVRGRDPTQLSGAIAALTGSHRYIFDYLADQVFDRQPEAVRRFLLHTSILDRLHGALCDAVANGTGPGAAAGAGQAMLEQIEAASLFIVPLDDTRTWYRYHHLFADFLRERLRRDDPDDVREMHRRAYRWYEEQGLRADAVDHALAASDHAQAARLIEQVGTTLLWQRGEAGMLLRWAEQLPPDVAARHPRLCLDLAWALLWSDQIDAIEPRLQDAEQALVLPGATSADVNRVPLNQPQSAVVPAIRPGYPLAGAEVLSSNPHPEPFSRVLRGEIATLRAELARQRGDRAAAIDLARRALEDLPDADRRLRGVTLGCLAEAYLWSGNAAAACQAFTEAVTISQAWETITLALFASGRLIQAQALHGRLQHAAATYQQTLDLAGSYGLPATPAIGMAKLGMADVLREWNELDAAEDFARQGIAQCIESGGQAERALDGCLTLARVLQARGDGDGALAALRQAETIGQDSRINQAAERVAAARARLWLTSTAGDIAATARWADERAVAWRADEPPGYAGLLEHITLARLRIVQGRRDDAAALLARLLAIAEAGGLMGCAIEILALQARLLLDNAPGKRWHHRRHRQAAHAHTSRRRHLGTPHGRRRWRGRWEEGHTRHGCAARQRQDVAGQQGTAVHRPAYGRPRRADPPERWPARRLQRRVHARRLPRCL